MDDLTAGDALPHVSAANIDLTAPRNQALGGTAQGSGCHCGASGAIDLEEACRRYWLSEEEFHACERGIATRVLGLRGTRLQIYCDAPLFGHAKLRYKYYASRNRGTMFPNI